MIAPVSTLWRALARADGVGDRRRAARRALVPARPWEEWRPVLAAALASDPARAEPALAALADEAAPGADTSLYGRLLTFQAHAAHRAGRMDAAVVLYERSERALLRSDAVGDALASAIARIDALAAAGRVTAALALARALAAKVRGPGRRRAAAALDANRGNALRLLGDVDEAHRAYDRAARTFDRLGDARRAAATRLNAGVTAIEAGDVEKGRVAIAHAARELARLGFPDLAAEARANLAWADVHAGRLGDGIRALDVLAADHHAAGLARREGICRMDLADALRRAGDAAAARHEATRAAACFDAARAPAERAEALFVAAASAAPGDPGALALARAAYDAARRTDREALALRAELASPTGLSLARANRGRPVDAAAIARRARALGHRALEAEARLLEGALALTAGRSSVALRAFTAAKRLSVGRPWTRLSADAGLAAADATRPGGLARALRRLRSITARHEAIRAELPGSWLRSRFAADRLDPELVRIDLLLTRGRRADRLEASAALDAIASRRVLRPRRDQERRIDTRTERIRARLEAIYDRIARSDGPTRGGASVEIASLERRAHAWERAFVARRRRSERRLSGSSFGPTASPRPRAGDVTSISLWRRGDAVLGLTSHGDAVSAPCKLGSAETWRRWEAGLRLQSHGFTHAGGSPASDGPAIAILAAIADRLLPSLGVDRWRRRVTITADPTLPDLPWELLPSGADRLGSVHGILRTPFGSRPPVDRRSGRGAVVLGVSDPELAGVHDEAVAVAGILGAGRALVGPLATRAALSRALASACIVHVAGHGWDAEEAPPLSGVRLADGWFCADDVPDVVAADLVVLAACRTGRAVGSAAAAWGGLVLRLLSQGARRVVFTDDDVDDRVAEQLLVDYHATRAGWEDHDAFGRALVCAAGEFGSMGAVIPFRVSGVEA